jgi:hypothetical protein
MAVGIVGTLIGIFTLVVLYRQGRDAQRAITYAKQSAEAALLNAQAVMNAERAWVIADLSGDAIRLMVTNQTTNARLPQAIRSVI